jgi:hypothetical protein
MFNYIYLHIVKILLKLIDWFLFKDRDLKVVTLLIVVLWTLYSLYIKEWK